MLSNVILGITAALFLVLGVQQLIKALGSVLGGGPAVVPCLAAPAIALPLTYHLYVAAEKECHDQPH